MPASELCPGALRNAPGFSFLSIGIWPHQDKSLLRSDSNNAVPFCLAFAGQRVEEVGSRVNTPPLLPNAPTVITSAATTTTTS